MAYRIRPGQKNIVFSGDQNNGSRGFVHFARGDDIPVIHMPVPENTSGTGRILHALSSIIGNIATEMGAGTLVLSHFMARSLKNVEKISG